MGPFPLSLELLDLIVHNIDDDEDLQSCRLVPKTFFRAASQTLFQDIDIALYYEPSFTEGRCKVLNDMIQSKPYILHYIFTLRIDLSMGVPWTQDCGTRFKPNHYALAANGTACVEYPEFTKLLLNISGA